MSEGLSHTEYEKRLQELKKEERSIIILLAEIKKQLNGFKVEHLHISSVAENPNEEVIDVSSDEELRQMEMDMDVPHKINNIALNLSLGQGMSSEPEEEEDSD